VHSIYSKHKHYLLKHVRDTPLTRVHRTTQHTLCPPYCSYMYANMRYFVMSASSQVSGQAAMECIPLVMEPRSRFYTSPVVVLDFQVRTQLLLLMQCMCIVELGLHKAAHAAAQSQLTDGASHTSCCCSYCAVRNDVHCGEYVRRCTHSSWPAHIALAHQTIAHTKHMSYLTKSR
jgi:hypothetical protein